MPDILTHLLVGLSLSMLIRKDDSRPEQMLIILGAVIIDIERPITWLLAATDFYWLNLVRATHSILGAAVLAYFAAACFQMERTSFLKRFQLISIGCASHLFMDLTMHPWSEMGLHLLYPLGIPFSFGLFWSDYWWYPLYGILALLAAIVVRYVPALFRKKHSSKDA